AVEVGPEAVRVPGRLADARARRGRQRVPVRVEQWVPLRVDRLPGGVDRPPEVVHWMAVGRAQREAVRVDTRQSGRMRTGAGRVDVPAEVEGLRLLGAERR